LTVAEQAFTIAAEQVFSERGADMDRQWRTAVVTGASSGIGAAFAEALAPRAAELVLVARREERLHALAERLRGTGAPAVRVVVADLQEPDGVRAVLDAVADREVDLLVNNAGFATHGPFAAEDPARIAGEIALNVGAVVALTRGVLPGMVGRGRGAVLNVASTAAFQPVPFMAVYGATKAFVLSFTEALWGELRGSGVRALAVAPGATATEFFDVAGDGASVGRRGAPERVVATALRALDRPGAPPSVVPGRVDALTARLPRLLPRSAVVRVTRRLVAPA
jgi:uncharacterized protein